MYNLLVPGMIGIQGLNNEAAIKLAKDTGFAGVSFDIFEAKAYADENGNVGLLFDVWHHYCAHGTLEDMDVLTAEDVQLIHTNDAPLGLEIDEQQDLSRTLPMETGVIPAVKMLQKLKEIGVTAGVAAEPFSAALNELAATDPVAAAEKTFAANKKLLDAAGI